MDLANYELYAGSASPLVGATVTLYAATLTHPNPGAIIGTTQTDPNGRWAFLGLAFGAYDVKVAAPGAGHIKWYKGLVSIGVSQISTSTLIDNADVAEGAAIELDKLQHVGAGNVLRSVGGVNVGGKIENADIADSQISSSKIVDDTIMNGDINSAANIALAKLIHVGANNVLRSNGTSNVAGQVANADIVNAAGIPYSKLNLTGSVAQADIVARACTGTASQGAVNTPLGTGGPAATNSVLQFTGVSSELDVVTVAGYIYTNAVSGVTLYLYHQGGAIVTTSVYVQTAMIGFAHPFALVAAQPAAPAVTNTWQLWMTNSAGSINVVATISAARLYR